MDTATNGGEVNQTMPAQADELQTGDILLMLGQGPLSDLIAWASDGPYSHAAMVADAGDLIEASAAGVRRYPLAQRLADQVNYHYIDAFRVHGASGSALSAGDLGEVLAEAVTMLGIPYPVDQLALLGAIMAVRGKWPVHPLARLLVREALDHAVPDDASRVVCSEMVYRAYAECAATPDGRLAPRIIVGERGDAPFPDIDWKALFDEVWPLLRPPRRQALQSNMARLNALKGSDTVGVLAAMGGETVSDGELEQARQVVLARLGATPEAMNGKALMAGADPVDKRPNPKLVSPQDLAVSPSVGALGRLMQRAGGG